MSYFVRRAEQQLELAQQANHEQVVHAHYELANLYLDKAYSDSAPSVEIAAAAA
ncbi:hypothetical protein [Sphingomonas sp. Leaf10]|jgi:aspartokinase-like uncharacterized kinase|uniref:hypothetical protein n=1 Tax=Sphingomonas sp. Leaf10 TaxID=1735676 RepID=UPI0019106010|nr:hypothetical protein [Sphingomonas sp. Leaf10]